MSGTTSRDDGNPSDHEVREILRYLGTDGFRFEETSTDTFSVSHRDPGFFAHQPVLSLPRALLTAYLAESSAEYPTFDDPYAEALSMTQVLLEEILGTDQGDGVNLTRAAGIRLGRDGRPELFDEQDDPVPPEPLDPDSGPYEWTAERPPW
jgi:hypothetical protein